MKRQRFFGACSSHTASWASCAGCSARALGRPSPFYADTAYASTTPRRITSPKLGATRCSNSDPPLQDRTVNIKWYLKREGLLDTTESTALDYYLVLSGPPSAAVSSRGTTRPWCIEAVFLFDARRLRSEQIMRGVKRGVASSVIKRQWAAAEIYPSPTNAQLTLSPQQVEQLKLFAL
jgi:hypothetical protein